MIDEETKREIKRLKSQLTKLKNKELAMRTAMLLRGVPISVSAHMSPTGPIAFMTMANGENVACRCIDFIPGNRMTIIL